MRKRKMRLAAAGLCVIMAFTMAGCGKKESKESSGEGKEKKEITVGCLARDEEIVNWIADKLSDKYDIKAQVYSETISIMQAAAEGSNELNYIANIPYLNSYNESYGSDLVYYADQITNSPVYVISQRYKTLEEIPDNAVVAVANDNSNRSRELDLLQANGLIEVDPDAENASALDITSNPKNLQINEIDARSRVGALPDLDAETMPAMTFHQMDKDVRDKCNILATESDQACLDISGQGLCCLEKDADSEWMKDIYDAACTKEFGDWLLETYEGARIPTGYYLQSGEMKYENPTFEVPDIY